MALWKVAWVRRRVSRWQLRSAVRRRATSIVERGAGLLFTRVDDDLVALDPQAGCCHGLNGPTARVWESIDSATPVSILCDRLIGAYEVDRATCLGDVIELIDELRAAKLVRVGQAQA